MTIKETPWQIEMKKSVCRSKQSVTCILVAALYINKAIKGSRLRLVKHATETVADAEEPLMFHPANQDANMFPDNSKMFNSRYYTPETSS